MRIVSLFVALIIIFLLMFTYFKSTQKVLEENVNAPGTNDSRIEHTKKTMEDMNKAIEEQKKAADKLMEK
jgi:hypothetical protein